jgi:hypothetical protein
MSLYAGFGSAKVVFCYEVPAKARRIPPDTSESRVIKVANVETLR